MGTRERRDREFSAYVAERSVHLLQTAFLLCGDRHRAEDLVQTALIKVYLAWERVERRQAIDAYVRRTLVHSYIDDYRKPFRREVLMHTPPDLAGSGPDPDDGVLEELAILPPRQRAAVVLRYWHDLSVEETARAMGCTPSTVKTQCARGLARLRTVLAPTPTGPTGGTSREY